MTASTRCARRSPCSRPRARCSSTPARWLIWAPPCGALAAAPAAWMCSVRGWISRTDAERARSQLAPVMSSWRREPRRDALRGRDALTASELRTARMAAHGLANREIAQALFVSLRTVETHLTHAYRKLEISSRAELSDALETTRPRLQAEDRSLSGGK